ncbi:MAG: hypothetical protein AAFX58_12510 [Pseudomonadota bacterium]
MTRRVVRFLAAVLVGYTAAALAATQSVLARVHELGLPVGWGTRLDASMHDLAGMATSLLPLLAIAYLLAFAVAALLTRRWPAATRPLYVLAGAVALVTLHVALKLSFDITPVAQARSYGGLAIQALAGALGGAVFAVTASRPRPVQ